MPLWSALTVYTPPAVPFCTKLMRYENFKKKPLYLNKINVFFIRYDIPNRAYSMDVCSVVLPFVSRPPKCVICRFVLGKPYSNGVTQLHFLYPVHKPEPKMLVICDDCLFWSAPFIQNKCRNLKEIVNK